MKKLVHLFVVTAMIGCATPKQYADYSSGSGFSVANVDSVSVENLTVLAKVWGFAKYHHPVFADSTLNVDYELFELLPRVACASHDERNAVLAAWVAGLGEFKSAEEKLRREIAEKDHITASDTAWLCDEALLGAELSETLQRLRYAKRAKPSRYASITERGHVTFDAESGHAPFFSDTGYNLLTLFRLWNMAEYYFPSVGITNKKWADVLVEYIPKFLTATNNIKWITAELIAELSDSHSDMYNNPAYGDNKLPVEFGFVEGKLIVTDNRKYVAEGEEPVFELGDEIVSIDGHTPEYFVERTRRYIAASNENVLLRDAAELASRAYNENVSVAIQREGRQMALDITSLSLKEFRDRSDEWLKNKTYYELLNDSVGYIYPAKFDNADGTNAQRVGVRIDHHVTPTIEGIRTGRDEVLEKALEIVANPFSACCGR